MLKNIYILPNGKFVAYDHNQNQLRYYPDEWNKMKYQILKKCTAITIIEDYRNR